MMNIQQQKLECRFRFVTIDDPESVTSFKDGILHLFQHDYDANTSFWWGVAEINCSMEEYWQSMTRGKPFAFCIQILLEDGRLGVASQSQAELETGLDRSYVRVALIGKSDWKVVELESLGQCMANPKPNGFAIQDGSNPARESFTGSMDGDTTYRFLSFAGERHAISSYQTTFVQIHCEENDKAVPPSDNELHCVSQAIGMIAGTRVIKAHGALSVVLSEPLHSNQQESQS